ncbi:MAG TPA: toast rack family protein [Anaerolineales bacterium]|nr:toast rack family protein [Anaerolineales bacterium]
MNTKHSFSILFVAVLLTSLACSFGAPSISQLETGPVETLTLNEPRSSVGILDVIFDMALGELNLSNGADELLDGEIRYNVADWAPTVVRSNDSLTISQDDGDYTRQGFPGDDIVNVWDVRLGNVPMNLVVSAGAYDASMNLSGLPILRLTVQDGASQVEVRFDELNPEEMDRLSYQTGASEITFIGLANANFAEMNFDGGAGEYSFDFSGDLQRDAAVTIDVGLSSVRIIVPSGVSAQVDVEGGPGRVNANGTWQTEGDTYVNPGSGPQLTITVNVGAGDVHLANQ